MYLCRKVSVSHLQCSEACQVVGSSSFLICFLICMLTTSVVSRVLLFAEAATVSVIRISSILFWESCLKPDCVYYCSITSIEFATTLLLSHFSRVRVCVTPSLGFSRQEHWTGLPFPSPIHKTEKWKWSLSVMSDSLRPHGLQPTRLLHPWDFPGKSTGVGCHCLLPDGL